MAENLSPAEAATLNQGRTFLWHELYCANSGPAIDFYTNALDFGTEEMSMGEYGTYKMLTRNGIPVCGVVSTEEMKMEGVPPHWATYISVDDVDKRVKMCEELGARLLQGPMDIPTVGRMALILDPAGATVWLFTPAPR